MAALLTSCLSACPSAGGYRIIVSYSSGHVINTTSLSVASCETIFVSKKSLTPANLSKSHLRQSLQSTSPCPLGVNHGIQQQVFETPQSSRRRESPARPSWLCKGSPSDVTGPDNSGRESTSGSSNDQTAGSLGSSSVDAGDEVDSWDIAARRRRVQEVAARMADPFRDMVTLASKKLQGLVDRHKSAKPNDDDEVQTEQGAQEKVDNEPNKETEWEGWQRIFREVDERELLLSALRFQLEEAIDEEDFKEASRVKDAINGCAAGDAMAEAMMELQAALEAERYSDAAHIRDEAGLGLVGWWVGLSEGVSDLFGRIVNISAMQGRLVARSYSARQLTLAGEGTPVFELFVDKVGDRRYRSQVVYLQRETPIKASAKIGPAILDTPDRTEGQEGEDTSSDDTPSDDDADALLNEVSSFLKDRLPGVKIQRWDPESENLPIGTDELRKLVEESKDKGEDEQASTKFSVEEDVPPSFGRGFAGSSLGGSDKSGEDAGAAGDQEDPGSWNKFSMRVVVGGVLQSERPGEGGNDQPPQGPTRVPAVIKRKGRDEFLLLIEDGRDDDLEGSALGKGKLDLEPSWRVATVAQGSAELAKDEILKVLSTSDRTPVKISKEMGEILRLAVTQALRTRGLAKATNFRRINVVDANSDPLSGLYIGAFGPYMSEVVQLRRKFGRWEGDELLDGDSHGAYEYVEAVKLTGDLNVPAGQVTFRAKIGRNQRLLHRGIYPEELGVVARYKGQGRLAEPGFKNPRWIEGELVLLNGKGPLGMPGVDSASSAELGFVYSVPERHFLVLFNRLKLQE